MKMTETGITQQNHNTKYNVVHPQCRGYVHKLHFIPLSSKPQLICALNCRSLQSLTAAHTTAGFCAHSCRYFFLSYKTLCAHSCRGRPRTQLGLILSLQNQPYFSLIFLYIKKPNLSSLHKCLFILRIFTKPWLQTMGTQKP